MCYARYLLLAVIVTMGVGQLLAACGQKGPLYLPKEPAENNQAE